MDSGSTSNTVAPKTILDIRHKKAEAGSLGFLQLKIFHRSKRSSDAPQSKATAHAQTEAILTADHPSQDGKAVAAIEKIMIADSDQLSDSWFKTEILDGLSGADIEFIDPSENDGEHGIVAVHLTTPSGVVRLD